MNVRTIQYVVIVLLSALLISGCSKGVMGENVIGSPGSKLWFSSASTATINSYYKNNCISYGFESGTTEMAKCMQTEINTARESASTRFDSAIQGLQERQERQRERMRDSHKTINCTTYGVNTTCRQW
jgi:hypothetical protein